MKRTLLALSLIAAAGTAFAQKSKTPNQVVTTPKMDTIVYTGNSVKSYDLLLKKFDNLREKLAIARLYDEAKLVDQLKADIVGNSRAVLQPIIPEELSEPMRPKDSKKP